MSTNSTLSAFEATVTTTLSGVEVYVENEAKLVFKGVTAQIALHPKTAVVVSFIVGFAVDFILHLIF